MGMKRSEVHEGLKVKSNGEVGVITAYRQGFKSAIMRIDRETQTIARTVFVDDIEPAE